MSLFGSTANRYTSHSSVVFLTRWQLLFAVVNTGVADSTLTDDFDCKGVSMLQANHFLHLGFGPNLKAKEFILSFFFLISY